MQDNRHRLDMADSNWMARASLLVALALLPLASPAAVYRCQGADGSVVFADSPCGPDAQVQAVRTPGPVSDPPPIAGATGSRGAVDARTRQRNESSACWLGKYDDWLRSQPKSVTDSSATTRAKMVEFENECHWTPRTNASARLLAPGASAMRPAPAGEPAPVATPANPARADTLDAYLADARLLTSRQAAAPAAILYSDPANGALLKTVLDPVRATAMLDLAMRAADTRRFDELKRLLEPIQKRYAAAFTANPRLHEPEYLDCLEINATLIRRSASLLQASQAAPARRAASTAKDARADQAVASLAQGMDGLMAAVAQMMAKGIREQVVAGKFSPAGARRATGIADSLAPRA